MATTDTFKFKNDVNNPIVYKNKQWIRDNPGLARGKETDVDWFKIEVFASFDKKKYATELVAALRSSGFLKKYPLHKIRIEPME